MKKLWILLLLLAAPVHAEDTQFYGTAMLTVEQMLTNYINAADKNFADVVIGAFIEGWVDGLHSGILFWAADQRYEAIEAAQLCLNSFTHEQWLKALLMAEDKSLLVTTQLAVIATSVCDLPLILERGEKT